MESFWFGSLAIWWLHGWVVGGFDCATVVLALSDDRPLSLFPCNTGYVYALRLFYHNMRGRILWYTVNAEEP